MTPSAAAAAFLLLTAVLAAIGTWVKWIRPRWRRARAKWIAAQDAIIGRDAINDPITGRELAPALPGIGVRMAHQEAVSEQQAKQMGLLTDAVAKLADQGEAIEDLRTRVTELENARVERVVTKAESIAAWKAIEATAKATPDTEGEVVDE